MIREEYYFIISYYTEVFFLISENKHLALVGILIFAQKWFISYKIIANTYIYIFFHKAMSKRNLRKIGHFILYNFL